MTIENKVAWRFEVNDEQPDPQRTEIVKAVVVLKSGVQGTER